MTDAEIIKALECCLDTSPLTCKNCLLFNVTNSTMVCSKIVTKFALDLINRQQADKERLERLLERAEKDQITLSKQCYKDAIKEFAERLKNEIISETAYGCDSNQHTGYYDYQIKIGDIPEYIDNLVKEMVGED